MIANLESLRSGPNKPPKNHELHHISRRWGRIALLSVLVAGEGRTQSYVIMATIFQLFHVIILLMAVQTMGRTQLRNGSITDICNVSSPLKNSILTLTGDETLTVNQKCRVENAVNLTIQGSPETRSTIRCSRKSGRASSTAFTFNNTYQLTIKNINFVGCGGILTEDDRKFFSNSSLFFFSEGQAAVILCTFCFNLSLVNVNFSVNNGYAFAGVNVWGHSVLESITVNGKDDPHLPFNATICEQPEFKCTYGVRGVLLLFVDSDKKIEDSTIQIKNSSFDYNYYTHNRISENVTSLKCIEDIFNGFIESFDEPYPMPDVGALTIIQNQKSFNVQVSIFSSNFTNNYGLCFGAVLAVIYTPFSSPGQLIFLNCLFSNNSPSWFLSNQGKNYLAKDITIQMKFLNQSGNCRCVSLINSAFTSSIDENLKYSRIAVTQFPESQG